MCKKYLEPKQAKPCLIGPGTKLSTAHQFSVGDGQDGERPVRPRGAT